MSIDQHPPTPVEAPPEGPASEGSAPDDPGPAPSMTAGQWARLGVVLGLLVLLTATTGAWGLVMVLGIVVMITLHELGHFVMAKRAGMKVTEFFLGFGPRVWSIQRGETEYGLKLVPAGAYVKIVGMHNIEEVDPADEALTYRQKPFWARIGVAVAGSTVHFLLALGLIFILLAGVGLPAGTLTPDEDQWRVEGVEQGTPAFAAGLRDGDDVVALDGRPTPTFESLREVVYDRPGDEVALTVERDGRTFETTATLAPHEADPAVGFLGVGQTVPEERLGVLAAVPATFREFGNITRESTVGLARVFSPSRLSDFGSQVANARDEPAAVDEPDRPVRPSAASSADEPESSEENRLLSLLGVFRLGVGLGDTGGVAGVLLLFALMNVFIGLFNLLPMLPFDGGHVAIAVYERFQERRRHLSQRYFADVGRLLPMTYAVVGALALLFASTLYLDIASPLTVN
ncbi:MAG TPA: M50 family metallopeptidase [Acidimicrobiales bacterium]|nr:M50 family metallopeptidase [Acidimicrobiales bacterium]